MKIATWNVNSIRSRLDHMVQWLEANPVDVLCVQETKVTDQEFPRSAIEAIGYQVFFSGQKSYNGVALISRTAPELVNAGFAPVVGSVVGEAVVGELDEQKRVISGQWGNLQIVNLYVPNGSEVGSEKYAYKLRWLSMLRDYLKTLLSQYPHVVVCGDFNIAPEDRDIYNPTGKTNHIMASPQERIALQQSVLELGFIDAFRQFSDESEQFTWWDYRAAAFRRNMGWRIDHHYLSPDLRSLAVGCQIDKTPRTWEKPSDHTPVIVELNC